ASSGAGRPATQSPAAQPVSPSVGQPPSVALSPAQLTAAYNLGPLQQRGIDGAGQTIVIVDSFGSPTIAADLASFDSAFGLRAPASLKVIQPAGPVPAYQDNSTRSGWASETSMDVEWAHAMAPAAAIVLVETPTAETEGPAGFPQIVTAENFVLRHHLGQVISQSFGATEETFSSPAQLLALRGPYELAARDHVTVLAASGDNGATGETTDMRSVYNRPVVEWPASDPLVTAVGGTQLKLGTGGQRLAPDSAWSQGGGGRSAIFARPSYQDGVARVTGSHRGIPDISMDASCSSPVAVYGTFGGGGWQTSCGTSLATPLMAGIVALADQVAGHPLGLVNPALYKMATARSAGITDILAGDNAVRGDGGVQAVPGFRATPGYDLASGTGTVNGTVFVPELARGG
ncbi:MAG: S53 family peptidase, partial [Actinomycetota bacterium]|nr:S53 family peptidase [Actinomycetota bacterium]